MENKLHEIYNEKIIDLKIKFIDDDEKFLKFSSRFNQEFSSYFKLDGILSLNKNQKTFEIIDIILNKTPTNFWISGDAKYKIKDMSYALDNDLFIVQLTEERIDAEVKFSKNKLSKKEFENIFTPTKDDLLYIQNKLNNLMEYFFDNKNIPSIHKRIVFNSIMNNLDSNLTNYDNFKKNDNADKKDLHSLFSLNKQQVLDILETIEFNSNDKKYNSDIQFMDEYLKSFIQNLSPVSKKTKKP